MILCIDIGNTSITYAILENNNFNSINRISSNKHELNITDNSNIKHIAISSVVPNLTDYYQQFFNQKFNINPFIVNHQNCNINLNVDSPHEVGADRICNVIGAREKYGTPSIVIDFGSATTYDIIDENGAFIGGAIAPGIDVSANYLIKKAALLNKTAFQFPSNVIGKNTETNLQSGIMYGGLDSVEGMIRRIKKELNYKKMNIVLTGGFSHLISNKMTSKHILDESIRLYGLKLILNNQ